MEHEAGPAARAAGPASRRSDGPDPAEMLDEVARIRDALDRQGIRALGFAAAPEDGATWALLVESEEIPLLEEIVADPDS